MWTMMTPWYWSPGISLSDLHPRRILITKVCSFAEWGSSYGGWWLIKVQNRTFSKKRSLQKNSLRFFWWNSIFYIVNTHENVIKIKFPHRLAPHRRWFEVGVAREEGGIHVVVALCCVQHSDKSSCCSRGRIRRVYEDMDFHGAPIGHRKHTLNFIHNVQIISIMYF